MYISVIQEVTSGLNLEDFLIQQWANQKSFLEILNNANKNA